MLYFIMFIVFLLLIVGPIVASKFIKGLPSIPMNLIQPTGLNNNDTTTSTTGKVLFGDGTGAAADATGGGGGGGGGGEAAATTPIF